MTRLESKIEHVIESRQFVKEFDDCIVTLKGVELTKEGFLQKLTNGTVYTKVGGWLGDFAIMGEYNGDNNDYRHMSLNIPFNRYKEIFKAIGQTIDELVARDFDDVEEFSYEKTEPDTPASPGYNPTVDPNAGTTDWEEPATDEEYKRPLEEDTKFNAPTDDVTEAL